MTDYKYKELIESLKAIVWSASINATQFSFVSKEAETALGYSMEEWLVPQFWATHLHPDDKKEILKKHKKGIKNGLPYELEYRMIAKSGKVVWFRNLVNITKEANGKRELHGIKVNITQQKSAEIIKDVSFKIAAKAQRRLTNLKTLSKTIHKELNKVLDATSFYIALHNEKKNTISFPFRIDAHVPSQKVFDERPFSEGLTEQVIKNGRALFLDKKTLIASLDVGKGIVVGDLPEHWLGVPIKSEGKTIGAIVTQTYNKQRPYSSEFIDLLKFIATQLANILDREFWQNSIIRNEERLIDAQQAAKIGSWEWNIITKELWWSGEAYAIFGLSPQYFSPTLSTFLRKIHADDRKLVRKFFTAVSHKNEQYKLEHRIVLPDNSIRYVAEIGKVRLNEEGIPSRMVGTIQDITERKETEISLKESQHLLSSINKNIEVGIFRRKLEKGLVYVNNAFAKIFGYNSVEEVLQAGRTSLYVNSVQGENFTLDLILNKSCSNVEILFKKKDGSQFWGLISSVLMENNGEIIIDGAIRDITELKLVEEKLQKVNEKLTWQNTELEVQEEELSATNADLLEKQETLKTTLNELSDRNYELDQLIYKTTHDLRSPLTSVLGLINIMKIENDPDKFKEYLVYIEERIIKLDEFVKSMLTYAKANRSEITSQKIDFQELVNTCILELEYLPDFKKVCQQISIEKNLTYFGDPLRLQLIFANLISNSYKYLNAYIDDCFLKISIISKENIIEISISDNGIGIKKEYIDKVFDMFFRATDNSKGSGLGLYLVKQTIDKLNGNIKINSIPNKGTEVIISLPITEKEEE